MPRSDDGFLDDENFSYFLEKITLFILAYSVTNPGVSTLRTPIYDEMISIIHNKPVTFHKYAFDESQARGSFENYTFSNSRGATRAMVTWWAHTFKNQTLLNISEAFQLEHIYPRKRQDMERGLQESRNLDALGNKILLEESINIKASDYRFEDKKKFYSGQMRRGSNGWPQSCLSADGLLRFTTQIRRRVCLAIGRTAKESARHPTKSPTLCPR